MRFTTYKFGQIDFFVFEKSSKINYFTKVNIL